MKLSSAGRTHVGMKRTHNEDSPLVAARLDDPLVAEVRRHELQVLELAAALPLEQHGEHAQLGGQQLAGAAPPTLRVELDGVAFAHQLP